MSNLSTLLEAARFVEMQELKEQQHRAAVEAALAASKVATTTTILPLSNFTKLQQQHHQTMVITTSPPPQPMTTTILQQQGSTSILKKDDFQQQQLTSLLPEQHQMVTSTTNNNNIAATFQHNNNNNNNNNIVNNNNKRVLLHNSFDIINNSPLVIDETNGSSSISSNSSNSNNNSIINDFGNPKQRRQVPIVFRAGTREVHNKLEKHRRAHLKECFDVLKNQLPVTQDEKKTSNLSILHSALRYIQTLKRKERELEHEMERLARDKISAQHRLALLKKDISLHFDNVDFSKILPDVVVSTTICLSSQTTNTTASSMIDDNQKNNVITTIRGSNDDDLINKRCEVVGVVEKTIQQQIDRGAVPVQASTLFSGTKTNHLTLSSTQTTTSTAQIKDVLPHSVQQQQQTTTALSVLPVGYPVNQGLVLQKVAIVPSKGGLTGLTPLMSTHFITTTPQQLNGKVVPLMNAQYVVKPVVVVSTAASPRSS